MSEGETAAGLLACIDAEQHRLRELLSGMDESMLAARPRDDRWSVVENLRHLLFAEQLHLVRFAPGGPPLSPLGLPPHGMQRQQRFSSMDFARPADVDEVLDAWETAHAATCELVRAHDTAAVRTALERNLRHLRAHIKVIERLLRTAP